MLETPWLAPLRPIVQAGLRRAGVTEVQEVWCEVPLELARRRFTARMTERHPVHPERDGRWDGRWEDWSRDARPLAFGRVHRVDTSAPVDVAALAAALRAVQGLPAA